MSARFPERKVFRSKKELARCLAAVWDLADDVHFGNMRRAGSDAEEIQRSCGIDMSDIIKELEEAYKLRGKDKAEAEHKFMRAISHFVDDLATASEY